MRSHEIARWDISICGNETPDEIGWDLMGSDENHAMLGAAANGSHMASVIIQMNGWGNAVEKSALPRGNFGVTPWKTRGYPVEKSAWPSMKTPRLQPALGQQVLLFASISVSYEEGSYVICIGQIGEIAVHYRRSGDRPNKTLHVVPATFRRGAPSF